jgi:PIN domain nuclease of toxin-antitoxin system
MKFLLDTHTWLWWNVDLKKLSGRVRELISDPANELLLSVVTPWELAIKMNAGKLDVRRLLENFEARESAAGFTVLRPSAAQVIRSGLLPLHHKDPFDRLLAAQALDLDATFLSRDAIFDLYGVKRIWN